MKKFMLFATAVGMTLTSCVNDEEATMMDTRSVITFDAPALKSARVTAKGELMGAYPTNESFKVFCHSYTGNYTNWGGNTNEQNYFKNGGADGDVASHNANTSSTTNYWTTTTAYVWPDEGVNLAFAAYSPAVFGTAAAGATVTRTAEGLQIADFKTESNSDDQYDLMYTPTVPDRNKANNSSRAVPLLFKHALSSIVFSTQKADAAVTYEITDLKVTGTFTTHADFNQGITGSSVIGGNFVETQNPTWTSKATESVTYDPTFTPFNVPMASPEIFTSGTSAILPIPQRVPDDATVTIKYTKTATGSPASEHTASILLSAFKTADSNSVSHWECGKRYVYRIAFGQNERIYFEPTIEPWETQPTLIYTLP